MKFHRTHLNVRHSLSQISETFYITWYVQYLIINLALCLMFINYVQSQEDFGVTVTSKLLWTNHCDKLANNANSKVALLIRTCHFSTNKKQKRAFYLTVVRSIFEHCSMIWQPVSSNQLSKFDALQTKTV